VISLILKTSMALTLSYIVFSFQISGKYVFDHVTDFTGPLGENIQSSLGMAANNTWDKSKEVGSQLFTNSKPKVEKLFNDSKKSITRAVAPKVQKAKKQVKEEFLEDLKQEEMSNLDKIIETH